MQVVSRGVFYSLAVLAAVVLASLTHAPAKSRAQKKAAQYAELKMTFQTFIEAVRGNDLEAAKKCWFIAGDNKSGALDVIVGFWVTLRQVNQVVVKKFGDKEAQSLLKSWYRDDVSDAALDLTKKRLADAEVKIHGDTANLKIKWKGDEGFPPQSAFFAGREPMPFRKIAGNWKFDASEMLSLKQGADFFRDRWGAMLRDHLLIMDGVADGIKKGRLKTTKEVKEFLDRKFAALEKKYAMEKAHKKERKWNAPKRCTRRSQSRNN